MELFIAVAMACVFVAGRKSVRRRIRKVDNLTDYRIDFTYNPNTDALTITRIYSDE